MEPFPLSRPARLAVFASGRGSNLSAILEAFPAGHELGSVELVVSNNPTAGALEKAREADVTAIHVRFSNDRERFERRAEALLEQHGIDLVCLAGFMRVLSAGFVERYAGRILNVHPSLLPEFPGLSAPRQALNAGARQTGCSVHIVDAGIDTGPVILQRSVSIHPGDSEASLLARIQAEEHRAYPEAIRMVLTGEAEVVARSHEALR